MEQIKKIYVSIQFDAEDIEVGELVNENKLIYSYSGHGMHSTMVAGESAKPTRQHLMKLATYFKIKNANLIIDEVQAVVTNWKKYAALDDVMNDSKNSIQKVIGR
jgi:serine/threonine-protein kinase HipA